MVKVSLAALVIVSPLPKTISLPVTVRSPLKDVVGDVTSTVPSVELVMVSSFSRVMPPEPLTSIPVVAVKLSDVTEVAPVTTPASTLTVPSRTIAEPDAGVIFTAPEEVLSVTAASPWFISSAATVPAVTLNSADPSTAGNFPRLSNWTI